MFFLGRINATSYFLLEEMGSWRAVAINFTVKDNFDIFNLDIKMSCSEFHKLFINSLINAIKYHLKDRELFSLEEKEEMKFDFQGLVGMKVEIEPLNFFDVTKEQALEMVFCHGAKKYGKISCYIELEQFIKMAKFSLSVKIEKMDCEYPFILEHFIEEEETKLFEAERKKENKV